MIGLRAFTLLPHQMGGGVIDRISLVFEEAL
jgi:hypothetical protein